MTLIWAFSYIHYTLLISSYLHSYLRCKSRNISKAYLMTWRYVTSICLLQNSKLLSQDIYQVCDLVSRVLHLFLAPYLLGQRTIVNSERFQEDFLAYILYSAKKVSLNYFYQNLVLRQTSEESCWKIDVAKINQYWIISSTFFLSRVRF